MNTPSSQSAVELTREQLYERVWSGPMSALAPTLGLSDVGLKKTCKRMRVPTPPRGYWQRVAAGKTTQRVALPKLPGAVPARVMSVTFRRPAPVEPHVVEPETGPVADQRRYEALPENQVMVSDQLTDPHPLVARSVHLLRAAKADDHHRLQPRGQKCVAIDVTMGTVDRALRIFDALFTALDARGYRVEIAPTANEGSRTVVHVGAELVPIAMSEAVTRTLIPPAPNAKSWEAKRYIYSPTGRLTLMVLESYLEVRGSWSDHAKRGPLETQVNAIIVGLVENGEAMRLRRLAFEEAARQRAAEEERRRQAELRRQEKAARIRALDQDMRRLRKSRAVRDYVHAMRRAVAAPDSRVDDALLHWLEWAEGYADRLDPTREIEAPPDPDPHAAYRGPWGQPTEDTRPIW